MNNLNITERRNGNVTILDLAGKITLGDDSIKLRNTLRNAVKEDKKNILLNLAEVKYIDSSALGELVGGYVSLQKNDGDLKLLHLTARISELMMITKLLTVFEVFENEEIAVASFRKASENEKPEQSDHTTENLNKTAANL